MSLLRFFLSESKYEYYKDNPDYNTPLFELYDDILYSEAKRLTKYDEADVEQYDLYVNAEVFLSIMTLNLVGY